MIKERLIQVLEYKKIAKEVFYTEIGMTSASFRGNAKKTPLNSNAIENVLSKIPDLNPTWLLTGKGEMLNNSSSEGINQTIHGDNNQQAGKTITNADNARLADRIKELEKQIENKDALINSLMKQLDKLTDKL